MPSLGIRGSNPIWYEVNLWGKGFDDTYYLWILQNQIPYIPADVFQDPNLNTVWDNPIQFLGNGTLPNNIYFESDVVYRLEFRQHLDPFTMPTQADPLIYLVENYVADSGGSSPINTIAFASTNQISNPQFALIDFASPYSFTGISTDIPAPLQIGPDWFLDLDGTGSITLTQVPLNNAIPTPSNAPYALQLTLSGWTAGSVILRQRFFQNGVLWANKIVSCALTARVNGAFQTISAFLVDSGNTEAVQVLSVPTVDGAFAEFTGHGMLTASLNPDTPPAAYIDFEIMLPSNCDIYLTSIQLIVEDMPVEQSFTQDSINRQIDQTYHAAYPIVPIGTIIDFGGVAVPKHYLYCDGTAYNRTTYNLLFQALSFTETVTLTTSSTTFTSGTPSNYWIGMDIEGVGIPANTTVTNIVGTLITLSAAITGVGGSTLIRIFAWGNGDGMTTFDVPNLQGWVSAGAKGATFGSNGVGAQGGSNTVTLIANNLPPHVHPPINGTAFWDNTTGGTAAPGTGASMISGVTTGNNVTTNTPVSVVQKTALVLKCIRYE